MKEWVRNLDYSNWIEINLNKIASVQGHVEKLGLKISLKFIHKISTKTNILGKIHGNSSD